jgi:hypothetical protein
VRDGGTKPLWFFYPLPDAKTVVKAETSGTALYESLRLCGGTLGFAELLSAVIKGNPEADGFG